MALPMRRSVAWQIEPLATLGGMAEASGLKVSQAREAFSLYAVRMADTAARKPSR
jgi:hypothetical protein